ncbi:MAG: HTTM domain-containing protein [Candidatus Eremiobacteraeota bacterium]|nr:HTTM domain-containing protein [Candidatus Eremiobacteraeota bacterium]
MNRWVEIECLADREKTERSTTRVFPGGHVLRLDLRSLAVTRVAYGAILFLDTIVRWTNSSDFYSEWGVLPRRFLLELDGSTGFSLHLMSGSAAWLHSLLLLQAAAAAAMLLGWHTRWATLLSWLLLLSSHNRNPIILDGGDTYLRVMLFWLLLLPTGQRWSMDARSGRGDHYRWMPDLARNSLFGASALAVLVQISSVYWFAAIPKTDPSWTTTYTATDMALHLDMFLTPFGLFFRDSLKEHLPLLTQMVIGWEFWGPALLFFPFDRGQVRLLGILGFAALHLGFGMMMELGFFAWIGALTPLILLPAWLWDGPLRNFSTWVDHRFGLLSPVAGDRRFKWPRELCILALTVYCLAWNLANESCSPSWLRLPDSLRWIGRTVGLDQQWQLFAPLPMTEDGWYVIEGRFRDGRVLDLFQNGKEITWAKPLQVAKTYRNQRWRKYLMNIWLAEYADYRLPYGQYICRKWNKNRAFEEQLLNFDIIFMLEMTNPDGTEQLPEKKTIWEHQCFETSSEPAAR